ncbi:MAG TPA: DNA polymerase III subunit alpha, partial [Anaerolineae bacterium]
MANEFVHLHNHTEYSLLDGLADPKKVAQRAKEFGMPAVAITDHGTMFGAIEFHDACRAINVKPIIGVESYLARRTRTDRDSKLDRDSFHLLLLAENETGYKNLLQLASLAQLEGFYYYPRVDKEVLAKYSAGVICTSGCLSAEVPDLLKQGRREAARKALEWYREVFRDRFYVELQEHNIPELTDVNRTLISWARELNLPLVATNDVHYLDRADSFAQDILLCIQTNKVVSDPDRMKMSSSDFYFKSPDEMAALWREVPEALTNSLAIAERCNVDLSFQGYRLPIFPVPGGQTPETYLRGLCEDGFYDRYPNATGEMRERLDYELSVIHQMGFDTYFLIVWDLTRYAREADIWYNIRGSAAGSMVAYCLGITNLDPLPLRLVFERFLNPGRITMPDIDMDFPDDAREKMISYTASKYGRENVAQIITFGKMLAKAAIRDVGRALDYPLGEVDRVAKLIPIGPNQSIDGALDKVPEFRRIYDESDYLRKLIDTAKLLEGVARNASTHAAGVLITDKPVSEYVPLHRPTRGDEAGLPVTQFSMGDLERVGLLKMDYLGLATLTIMRRTCEMIEARYGKHYDLNNIPVEDPQAFELLSRGDVQGVFQVEGAGMKRVLIDMRPTRFDHIVATISLYRPGPMEQIPSYIRRLHGEEEIGYKHPDLEPVLAETFGIIVYQEQIIQTAVRLAGYKPGEADEIRKAVGKKIKEKIDAHRQKFVAGCVANGIERSVAEAIYGDIEFFARYGFNKAHAADYAVLTCQTAFLKAHYPREYMCALLTNEIGNLDKTASLVSEARRTHLTILSPDVRYSDVEFRIDYEQDAIRFG